jgi:hypothetical protein
MLKRLRLLSAQTVAGRVNSREDTLQTARQQAQHTFPGFPIASDEIATAGNERGAHGGIRHAVLPQKRMDQ